MFNRKVRLPIHTAICLMLGGAIGYGLGYYQFGQTGAVIGFLIGTYVLSLGRLSKFRRDTLRQELVVVTLPEIREHGLQAY